MLTPTEFEVHQLLHAAVGYDPLKPTITTKSIRRLKDVNAVRLSFRLVEPRPEARRELGISNAKNWPQVSFRFPRSWLSLKPEFARWSKRRPARITSQRLRKNARSRRRISRRRRSRRLRWPATAENSLNIKRSKSVVSLATVPRIKNLPRSPNLKLWPPR
jgi:hypothetical protein